MKRAYSLAAAGAMLAFATAGTPTAWAAQGSVAVAEYRTHTDPANIGTRTLTESQILSWDGTSECRTLELADLVDTITVANVATTSVKVYPNADCSGDPSITVPYLQQGASMAVGTVTTISFLPAS